MEDDPGQGVRRKKDSSLVRAAEAVRDGKAMAMVSAGNTGATMASALLRMGRLPGVIRPAIATPIPNPERRWPTVLLDSGANAECTPGHAGPVRPDGRGLRRASATGWSSPGWPCSPSARRSPRAPRWRRRPTPCWPTAPAASGFDFVGNVEGRDFFDGIADVIVTDGFTGNVALKTLEGSMRLPHRRPHRDPGPARAGRGRRRPLSPPAARWPPASTPTPPAGPCSSAWTACASSATAPRRPRPWSTPSPWPTTWPWPAWSRRWPPRSSRTTPAARHSGD